MGPVHLEGVAMGDSGGMIRGRFFSSNPEGIGGVEVEDAAFGDVDLRDAVVGGGEEEVVVTYDGSTLRGTKLTGDENVPAGQVSFEADLSAQLPRVVGGAGEAHVTERIRAVMESHVPVEAYTGRAQIAEKGFKRPQWIDGQLLLFQDGVFGFLFLQVPPAARPPCAQHLASQQQLLDHTLQQRPPHSSLQQSHSAAHCSTAQRAAADCGATAQLGSLIMFENCEARACLAAEKRAVGGDAVESERPPQADTGTVRFL